MWELQTFDWMIRLRPAEPPDERIIVVGIDEADLNRLGTSLISDQAMATLIHRIKAQQPRVIGLDFYRNLPTEPGHQALSEVLRSTPNLIGIEKVIGNTSVAQVAGNPILAQADRLAASDVVVDIDGRVRRGLLFPSADGPRVIEGFSWRLALEYLAAIGITPETHSSTLQLAGIRFPPFSAHDGGYVGADDGGYQILLNLRAPTQGVFRVSMSDVLDNRISPDLLHNRIVIIGSTSAGDSDVFFTPHSRNSGHHLQPIYGVELHAGLVSQIISAILDQRPLIQCLPEWGELCFLLGCAYFSTLMPIQGSTDPQRLALTLLLIVAIQASGYFLLLYGWWLPTIPASIAALAATTGMLIGNNRYLSRLSTQDGLTQLANRRTFNNCLEQAWLQALRSQQPLSLILCDVDYFKAYNDAYGHSQGDECLRRVAKALQQAIPSPNHLVARYGGEEFVIILPNTDSKRAYALAESIRSQVHALHLAHPHSQAAAIVTLSLGVACVIPSLTDLPISLVNTADLGLYEAKQKGRDRSVLKADC
ncbi:MAG: diguanylate cyclase [Cyanothece sp. SIO1E1]|nr:diguanylate cyclase [Cyanothece sp. SIO1E1]